MRLGDLAHTALRGIRAHLLRSLLAVLGILIGVSAIVIVISLGKGAENLILGEVQGMGGNTIIVRPGRQPEEPTQLAQTLFADSLKAQDIAALRRPENVPGAADVTPVVFVAAPVAYADRVYRPMIFGWSARALGEMFRVELKEGDFFGDSEIRAHARVAVIGARVRDELFKNEPAVGRKVRIKKTPFRVVGVFAKSGQVSFFNVDEIVIVPYTTAQKNLLGIDYYHEVLVKARAPEEVEEVAADIRRTLRQLHDISDPKKDDFFVMTQRDIIKRISTVTLALTVFLVSIAAVSLVVSGVGIMNIMLVAVTERTREIGLRKTLGATSKDIFRQFLLEALILTTSGGIAGCLIAIAISYLVSVLARQQLGIPWAFQIPLSGIILGIGTAAATGLFFGLFPAMRAARKEPIEALRYE
jgi:putative ABC transport system permease protein